MIHIKIQKEKEWIKKIEFKGHALYDDYGKDIVCAGVSSILTTTVNGILRIKENAIIFQQKKDQFDLIIQSQDEITSILIENMLCLLKELEASYPKNIKMESEE